LQIVRSSHANWKPNHITKHVTDPGQFRCPATEDDPCWQQTIVPGALDLLQDEIRDLVGTCMQDLSQLLPGDPLGRLLAKCGDVQFLVR
jgi:hypothetical protein